MWYVGLDWADTHHDVEVLDEAGKRVGARRFAHSHKGLNELKQFLLSIASSPENLACSVETNPGLLITFLLEAGIPVYPVNPKTANQLRTAAGAKTDQIDAHLLAKLGRLDLAELRRLEPDSPTVAELKTLTRDQEAWALEYYRRKRAEGKSHSMAVRALANIWVRIIYRMWQNKTCYLAATFEVAKLAHAPQQRVA